MRCVALVHFIDYKVSILALSINGGVRDAEEDADVAQQVIAQGALETLSLNKIKLRT